MGKPRKDNYEMRGKNEGDKMAGEDRKHAQEAKAVLQPRPRWTMERAKSRRAKKIGGDKRS